MIVILSLPFLTVSSLKMHRLCYNKIGILLKCTLLVAITVLITLLNMSDYTRHRESDEFEISRAMGSMNLTFSDLWVIQHAQITRESILKLRENTCKIPILNPFSPKVMNFFKSLKPQNLKCNEKTFYFKSHVKESTSADGTATVSQPMITTFREMPLDLRCCYEQLRFTKIHSYKPIVNLKTDRCIFFTKNETLVPPDSEYLVIKCWNTTKMKQKIIGIISDSTLVKSPPIHYELLFYVPQPSRKILDMASMRLQEYKKEIKMNEDEVPLNVVILGFDQISRANFIRLMGKTFHYLKTELDAIDLQGFNKMGDATLNNTLALLAGLDFGSVLRSEKIAFLKKGSFFDECPWVWKNFSEKGYITAYADDYTSVFNYRFKGFKRQPTDYYMAPFLLWYDNALMKRRFGTSDCIGNDISLNLISDHAKKMADTLKTHPYFHFMWQSKVSERSGFPSLADESTLETLKHFQTTGMLNRSLAILVSDHGWRAGHIMMNPQARLENRQTFAFLLLPPWFREKYSIAYENLQENQFRLTSPYDIHSTLFDILNTTGRLSNHVIGKRTVFSSEGSNGVSLFLPISKNRSCAQAGIDEEWCACTDYRPFPLDSPVSTQLAKFAVSTINSWLRPLPSCEQYTLDKVFVVEVKRSAGDENNDSNNATSWRKNLQFRVSFSVLPHGARFEVTIFTDRDYWPNGDNHNGISMSAEVFRLNAYIKTSCVKIYSLKKICTCK